MKHWMFNCNIISQYVSEAMDKETTFTRQVGIKFHLMMRRYCARYERQLNILRKTIRTSSARIFDQEPLTMSKEKKQIIERLLSEQQKQD